MKKFLIFLLLLTFAISLVGCSTTELQTSVYSFSGANEYFAISNGVIVLDDSTEAFYGGNISADEGFFAEATSYSATFYISSHGEKKVILSSKVVDLTGEAVDFSGEIGSISGDDVLTQNKIDEIDDLRYNLYCDLSVTNKDGTESVYSVQMNLTEIVRKNTNSK